MRQLKADDIEVTMLHHNGLPVALVIKTPRQSYQVDVTPTGLLRPQAKPRKRLA